MENNQVRRIIKVPEIPINLYRSVEEYTFLFHFKTSRQYFRSTRPIPTWGVTGFCSQYTSPSNNYKSSAASSSMHRSTTTSSWKPVTVEILLSGDWGEADGPRAQSKSQPYRTADLESPSTWSVTRIPFPTISSRSWEVSQTHSNFLLRNSGRC